MCSERDRARPTLEGPPDSTWLQRGGPGVFDRPQLLAAVGMLNALAQPARPAGLPFGLLSSATAPSAAGERGPWLPYIAGRLSRPLCTWTQPHLPGPIGRVLLSTGCTAPARLCALCGTLPCCHTRCGKRASGLWALPCPAAASSAPSRLHGSMPCLTAVPGRPAWARRLLLRGPPRPPLPSLRGGVGGGWPLVVPCACFGRSARVTCGGSASGAKAGAAPRRKGPPARPADEVARSTRCSPSPPRARQEQARQNCIFSQPRSLELRERPH